MYVADQSQFPDVDDSEIKTMDGNIVQLTQQLQVTMEEVKKLESGKATLKNIWFASFFLNVLPLERCTYTNRILHYCSCFIEFIKQVVEKR